MGKEITGSVFFVFDRDNKTVAEDFAGLIKIYNDRHGGSVKTYCYKAMQVLEFDFDEPRDYDLESRIADLVDGKESADVRLDWDNNTVSSYCASRRVYFEAWYRKGLCKMLHRRFNFNGDLLTDELRILEDGFFKRDLNVDGEVLRAAAESGVHYDDDTAPCGQKCFK